MNSYNIIKENKRKREKWWYKNHPSLFLEISNFIESDNFSEKLYCYYHNINKQKCYCGNELEYLGFETGYRKYCSKECRDKSNDRINKIKQTKLDKYNNSNYNNIDKQKETIKEKYGVDNIMQLEENKLLASENMKKNFTLIKNHFKEKYGVDNPSQIEEIQDKKKKNSLKKYGKLFQQIHLTEESIEKLNDIEYLRNNTTSVIMEETNISQSHLSKILIRNEISDGNRSTLEAEMERFLEHNNVEFIKNDRTFIKPYELDFLIPSKKLAIEINGAYFHREERVGKEYHLLKTNLVEEKGYQLIHIFDFELYKNSDIIYQFLIKKIRDIEIKNDSNILDRRFYSKNNFNNYIIEEPKCLYVKGIELVDECLNNCIKVWDCGSLIINE